MDALPPLGPVERRGMPLDRRAYGLHLTASGHQMLASIAQIARILDERICGGLMASLHQRQQHQHDADSGDVPHEGTDQGHRGGVERHVDDARREVHLGADFA